MFDFFSTLTTALSADEVDYSLLVLTTIKPSELADVKYAYLCSHSGQVAVVVLITCLWNSLHSDF